ncbi:hypothetical protein [Halomonas campaniensis]|uniref:Uncharacterized protein n=1 Tax=Halomonas campaniensis TaxID=213554 RepID=A0A246S179_9GAMM|nr:hypothetical protein [Halomonas campaniensis]OWV30173.1 hypothetical protein JI62_08120 [Halomonas campaniensis]
MNKQPKVDIKSVITLGIDEKGITTVCASSISRTEDQSPEAKRLHHLAVVGMQAIVKEVERLDIAKRSTVH